MAASQATAIEHQHGERDRPVASDAGSATRRSTSSTTATVATAPNSSTRRADQAPRTWADGGGFLTAISHSELLIRCNKYETLNAVDVTPHNVVGESDRQTPPLVLRILFDHARNQPNASACVISNHTKEHHHGLA